MSDPVIAKFKLVAAKTTIADFWEDNKTVPKKLVTLEFRPVNPKRDDPSDENSKFWSATPSGQIELGMVNQAAVDQFELGKEYYVTFTEART